MSFKPYRGSGIGYSKALENRDKYRELYHKAIEELSFESLKKASKYLYFYIENDFKVRGKETTISDYIIDIHLERFKRNVNILYVPLVKKYL